MILPLIIGFGPKSRFEKIRSGRIRVLHPEKHTLGYFRTSWDLTFGLDITQNINFNEKHKDLRP